MFDRLEGGELTWCHSSYHLEVGGSGDHLGNYRHQCGWKEGPCEKGSSWALGRQERLLEARKGLEQKADSLSFPF